MGTNIYEPEVGEVQVTRYAGPTDRGPRTRYQFTQMRGSDNVSMSVEEGAIIALAILKDAAELLKRHGREKFLSGSTLHQDLVREFGKKLGIR